MGTVGSIPDAAKKVRGVVISVILGSQVSLRYGFTTIEEMKSISQHCCDKTMDGKGSYIANAISNCTKSW